MTELLKNRILRYVQRPNGVYHGSVFYQCSGSLGPSCITCDATGRIYAGSYDFATVTDGPGCILILSETGDLIKTLYVPGSEITGLVVKDNLLYVTEASKNTLYCLSLSAALE